MHSDNLNPIAYELAKVEMAVFGVITWKGDAYTKATETSEALRSRDFWWLLHTTCGRLKVRQRHLATYYKAEWGGSGRGHVNFLIAKDGIVKVTPSELAGALQDTWTQHDKGIAKIEEFDPLRHWEGVAYQSKVERDEWGNELWCPEVLSPKMRRILMETSAETI